MLALDQIAVILPASAFWLFVLYLAAYRPVIFLGFFFILFTMLWRTGSTAFIDLAGPVWSSQTVRYVGPGLATPLHVLAYFVTLVPFVLVLQSKAVKVWVHQCDRRCAPAEVFTIADLTFALSSLFLAYLLVDMARRGSIPLFVHTERHEYTSSTAGEAHRWVVRYGSFLAFWWGLMVASGRLRNRSIDFRYVGLLATLLVYMFLSGNRFSAFYSLLSFFLIPLSAVAAQAEIRKSAVPFHWIGREFRARDIAMMAASLALVIALAAAAIFNNLVSVRGYHGSEVMSEFWERSLIQPSEMGWISYERIFVLNQWQPDKVYNFLFEHPLDPGKNTTPQYLMLETIGEPRTSEHILAGFQFAGGFPEIFFELFGPIYSWTFLLGWGAIAALLTALIVKGTLQGRYASAFMALYVLYGFFVSYIGGMLNFVTVESYWIKIAALAVSLILESRLAAEGLSLLPWAVTTINGPALTRAVRFIRPRRQLRVSK
ncbi:DUF6418 domain-containing protein [Bradyrhizobium sp. 187]|uniref:DUF6418 domain-containing protein n=1 Tax=Bradyrhizobium sp. 187 TaxID=2782655 RepID=UPI001FFED258|nr:DUF6418 domain-containing protein [Bradyrhizobium sp. 187]UPJ70884.1 hypothetical protein IVB19_24820 [Bradyrhizobium sp. 187]